MPQGDWFCVVGRWCWVYGGCTRTGMCETGRAPSCVRDPPLWASTYRWVVCHTSHTATGREWTGPRCPARRRQRVFGWVIGWLIITGLKEPAGVNARGLDQRSPCPHASHATCAHTYTMIVTSSMHRRARTYARCEIRSRAGPAERETIVGRRCVPFMLLMLLMRLMVWC